MFNKIVAIEPVGLIPSAQEKLHQYANEVKMYNDMPNSDEEIVQRIGDAQAVLVSHTTKINKQVIETCPSIKYIGICASLYSPESSNVDIHAANAKGIIVYGIRDYGDPGVVEYVVSELVHYLHGFGDKQWKDEPEELTNLPVGIVGLGTTGQIIGDGLRALGANIHYYSRTRKQEKEQEGYTYLPLPELLNKVDVVFCCLNKNVVLFHEAEFKQFGNNKIMFNTSIGPSHDTKALKAWLDSGTNEFFCDTEGALGDEELLLHPHVNCVGKSAGRTRQAFERLSEKVLTNIETFLKI